ncbi:hypothetical protein PENSPDRAFT_251980 [Peniophora sp. CONT]|nr:hypothetical protein PENSPDRAFT_251980 [Peniophora sp. CONT]
MFHCDYTQTSQPLASVTPADTTARRSGPNGGPLLIWGDPPENSNVLERAADAARKAGITASNPLRLLSFAQSAVARGVDGEFNADLHFAMAEMKSVVTTPGPGLDAWKPSNMSTSIHYCALGQEDQQTFIWETFELCCIQLSQNQVLEQPLVTLDFVFVLHQVLYEVSKSIRSARSTDPKRAQNIRKLATCLEQVWNNIYLSRDLVQCFSSVRRHFGVLSQAWTGMCIAHNCFPAWGTSNTYWLFFFLWMKQSRMADSSVYLTAMHAMDSIGIDASITLSGQALSKHHTEIMSQAIEIYGKNALLERFQEMLNDHSTLLPHVRLSLILKHVNRYAGGPLLVSELASSGILPLYLQATRRQQADGQWELDDARAFAAFTLNALVQAGFDEIQLPRITGELVEEEHLMRDFLLPALRMGLENLLWTSENSMDPDDGLPELGLVHLVASAAELYKDCTVNSSGHGVMNALRAEVSPYWHRFNAVILALPSRGYKIGYRKKELAKLWRRLGAALQLDPRRAPRQVEGPQIGSTTQAFCAWPLCPYHDQEPPHALKACAGCSDARYCSKQCQMSDWKLNDHKARCRRLKK